MDYYQKMYTVLFRAVTETIGDIEARNYGMAKERLIRAQQKCEKIYISQDENGEMQELERM